MLDIKIYKMVAALIAGSPNVNDDNMDVNDTHVTEP